MDLGTLIAGTFIAILVILAVCACLGLLLFLPAPGVRGFQPESMPGNIVVPKGGTGEVYRRR